MTRAGRLAVAVALVLICAGLCSSAIIGGDTHLAVGVLYLTLAGLWALLALLRTTRRAA